MILFSIVPVIILYTVIFLVTGGFGDEAPALYMLEHPIKYSLISFIASLPYFVIYIWSLAFLTIAYVRKSFNQSSAHIIN